MNCEPSKSSNHAPKLALTTCRNDSPSADTGLTSVFMPNTFSNGILGHWNYSTLPPWVIHWRSHVHSLSIRSRGNFLAITPGSDQCHLSSCDSTDDIVAQYDDALFRAGLLAGSWPNITEILPSSSSSPLQTIVASISRNADVLRCDYRWLFGASAIPGVIAPLILPAYWGWCKIGVGLTLSPFHTAKAFGAPLFRNVYFAAGSAGLVNEIGVTHVKLREVDPDKHGCITGPKCESRACSSLNSRDRYAGRCEQPAQGRKGFELMPKYYHERRAIRFRQVRRVK